MNASLYILINSRDIAIELTYWHVLFMKLKQLKCKKGCFSYTYTRKLYKYMSLHIRIIYYFFVIKTNKQTKTHKKPPPKTHTHTTSYIYFKINLIIFPFLRLELLKEVVIFWHYYASGQNSALEKWQFSSPYPVVVSQQNFTRVRQLLHTSARSH